MKYLLAVTNESASRQRANLGWAVWTSSASEFALDIPAERHPRFESAKSHAKRRRSHGKRMAAAGWAVDKHVPTAEHPLPPKSMLRDSGSEHPEIGIYWTLCPWIGTTAWLKVQAA